MARNLLDDEDWQHLTEIVGQAVSAQIEITENGVLKRLDDRSADQTVTLETVLARMGEPAAETLAARGQVREAAGLVEQLRRVIGSGNLRADQQAQVDNLFAELALQLRNPPKAVSEPEPVAAP